MRSYISSVDQRLPDLPSQKTVDSQQPNVVSCSKYTQLKENIAKKLDVYEKAGSQTYREQVKKARGNETSSEGSS